MGEDCYFAPSKGELIIGGNITGPGYLQIGGTHKTVFNGSGLQRVEVDKSSYFAKVEIDNTSEEGVSCLYFYAINDLDRKGNHLSYDGINGTFGWTLNEDTTINEDLVLIDDTLDLNGYKLVINGDFTQNSGVVYINGGELVVNGDYRIQKEETTDGNKRYVTGSGMLKMTNSEDRVLINGDFINQSSVDSRDMLTEGILEVKGDFYQLTGSQYNFSPGQNHTVVLSGNEKQTVSFSNSSTDSSYFNNLEIRNNSEEGVVLDNTLSYPLAIGNVNDNGNSVSGELAICDTTSFENNHYCSDLITKEYRVNIRNEIETEGNFRVKDSFEINVFNKLTVDKDINIQGYYFNVRDDVHVKGDLYFGGEYDSYSYIYLREGNLTVDGNVEARKRAAWAETWIQNYNYDTTFIVKGDLYLGEKCAYSANNGIFSISGNISGPGNLKFSGTHKTYLNGTELQIIEISDQTYFAYLEIQNTSRAGVEFTKMIVYDTFVRNGCRVSFGDNSFELGWTLNENEVYDSDLYLWDDTLDLNGNTLMVNGDFVAMGGKVNLNGGKLIVNGDFRLQSIDYKSDESPLYGPSSAFIEMNDPDDYILVNGNFFYCPKKTDNVFSDGIIEIKGDFSQSGENVFKGTLNNTVKFTGNTKQTLSGTNPSDFSFLINENSEELQINMDLNVGRLFVDETENISGSGTVVVSDTSKVKDGICSGNLKITGVCFLQQDLTVGNELIISNTLHANGKDIKAYNLSLYSSSLYVEKSKITVENKLLVSGDGKLFMLDDDDYVLVNGDFVLEGWADQSGSFKAGVLELRGDFYEYYSNFTASGTHTTVLSRKKSTTGREYIQTIRWGMYAGGVTNGKFNKVILKKNEREYHFFKPISEICNEYEYDIDDYEAPGPVAFIVESGITAQSVSISFGGAEDNFGILGYEVYRDGKLLGVTSNTSYTDNSVDSDRQYTYTVFAFDGERNKATSSPALTVRTLPDLEAPSVPQNVVMKTRTGSSVTIEWSPSSDNVKVSGYNVYANGTLLAEEISQTYFKATGLEEARIYKFSVEAVDKNGNVSEKSAELETEVKMPRITSVTPEDNKRIGGESTVLNVYFNNVGNSTGNKVTVKVKNEEGEWTTLASKLPQRVASYNSLYATYTWDISELVGEETYVIKYILTDADGNEDTVEYNYTIDREGPAAPSNFRATSNNGNVNILFDPSTSSDCDRYEIHRVYNNEDKILCVLSGRYSTAYTDNNVIIGETYEYYAYAYDAFGNKSAMGARVSALVEDDQITPEVVGFMPRAGRINSNVNLEVTATDNRSVSKIGIQYRSVDETEWTDIEEKGASNGKAIFSFNTTVLPDGEYFFNAYAIDESGNVSDELFTRRYTIDNTGIAKIVITNVKAASSYVSLEWEDATEEDFGYFVVEQLVDGEYVRVKKITDTLGVYVDNLKPETEYSFRVVGYDNLDNRGIESDVVTAVTVSDTTAPIINAIYPAVSRYNNVLDLAVEATDDNMLDYAVFSYSTDNTNFVEIGKVYADSNATHAKLVTNFDISQIREGSLFIKFEVYDICGNKNAPLSDGKDIIAEYTVDRTAPGKIQGLKSNKNEGGVEIEWAQPDQENDSDIEYFKVYRADNSNGIYKVVGEKVKSINFFDGNVRVGNTYLYKVSAVDVAGNEGECSEEIIVTVIKDDVAPVVLGLSPKAGNRLKADPTITVLCRDNSGVSKVKLEYCKDDEAKIWTKIGEASTSGNYTSSDINWDTDKLEEGNYSIKAVAVDIYGNESEAYVASYVLDKTAPVISNVSADTRNYAINVSVTLLETDDLSHIEILRREVGSEFTTIANIHDFSYLDNNVVPRQNYIYQVKVYDTAGNCSVSEEVSGYANDTDTVAPVAVLEENYTAIVGMEMEFDGSESYDNVRITEYNWEMGTGDVRSGATIKYTYNTPGQYKVVLTVKDSSGNTGTALAIVKVYERGYKGQAKVQVIDEEGKGIPYASVYVKVGSEKGMTKKANKFGFVDVIGDVGDVTIAAYKTDYLPKEKKITIDEFETKKYTISLVKDELVVGNLTVTRMTLEEMVRAGVDFSNPNNYCSYRINFTVVFDKQPIPVEVFYVEEGEDFSNCSSFYTTIQQEDTVRSVEIVPTVIEVEDVTVPIVTYMSTVQGTSWLKDMFNVELGVMNQADNKFVIENCYAQLLLPDGLSLANTKDKQKLKNDMGSICGQESKQTSWIVRGDKRGEYSVAADFYGILMPFEEEVHAHFEADTTIDVSLGEGIVIDIFPETVAYGGEYYYIHFAVTNYSEYPKYDFSTTFGRFDMPEYSITYTDVDTGHVEEYGSDFILRDPSTMGTAYIVSGRNTLRFNVLEPGQTYYGTYKTKIWGLTVDKDREEYYAELIALIIEDLSTENYGVQIRVNPIPAHLDKHRYKVEYLEKLEGDPIDLASGFYIDQAYPITVKGNSDITFEIDYNSGATENKGEMGYGWNNPYELKLEDKGGLIWFYSSPNGVVSFIDDDILECNYEGRKIDDEIYLKDDRKYIYGNYTCINSEMCACTLTKEENDTYVIKFATGAKYIFDSEGRLSEMVNSQGQRGLFRYEDNKTIITEEITQKSLIITHNEKGLVSEVSDQFGRRSFYVYDDFDNLISIVYPDGNTLNYRYDENHKIIEGSNQKGIFVTNEYDGKGRVTKQTDVYGNAIYLSYTALENGNTVVDVSEPNGLEKVIEVSKEGKILSEKQNGKTVESYEYESNGVIKYRDYYDNTSVTQTDSQGKIVRSVNANGEEINLQYDCFGNLIKMSDSSGRVVNMEYDANNCIISMEDNRGPDKNYYYNDNAQLIEEYTEGKGSIYYTYQNGLLESITDYNGNKTWQYYDEYGNKTRVTDAQGNNTYFSYNVKGELTSQTDALGNTAYYSYDINGNKKNEKDYAGNITKYEYDNKSQLIKTEYPDGSNIKYEYDSVGNCVKTVINDERTIISKYDILNNLTEVDLDGDIVQLYRYDGLTRCIEDEDESGVITKCEYYPDGNIKKKIYADGEYEEYLYTSEGLLSQILESGTVKKIYVYDTKGNCISETDACGNTIRYNYDAFGQLVSRTDARNNTETYEYDNNGNCISMKNSLDEEIHMVYDSLNRMTEAYVVTDDGERYSVAYAYDALGRIISQTDEEGNTTFMEYDELGNVTSVKDSSGNVISSNSYDSLGRVSTETDSYGVETTYQYDKYGEVITAIQQLSANDSRVTEYEYDKYGRLLNVKKDNLVSASVVYDAAGNVSQLVDPNGGITRYSYDSMNRIIKEVSAVGSVKKYEYNAQGLLDKQTNARGQNTTYSYDLMGRLISFTDELGTVCYMYDENGNVICVSDENGSIIRTFDALNRVTSYTDYNGNVIRYSYDELGNLISLTYPGGEIVRYEYYKNGWLKNVIDNNGKITSYTYDSSGRILTCLRSNNTKEIYTYDPTGILLEKKDVRIDASGQEYATLLDYHYSYDASGNVTEVEGYDSTYISSGIERFKNETFEYDDSNRLIKYNDEIIEYDADGNMVYGPVNGQMTRLSYDCRNRLISAGDERYTYDAENVRISLESGNEKIEFVTDTSEELSKVLVENKYVKTGTDDYDKVGERLYIFGNGLLYEIEGTLEFHHHYNHLGSTMVISDRNGQTVIKYSYGLYGELLCGDPAASRYLYNGKYGVRTEANGLYYMRQRYYNPEIKRFINQDILIGSIENPLSLNRYSYVQGNPANYFDPFGLCPTKKELTTRGIFLTLHTITTVGGVIGTFTPDPVIGIVSNSADILVCIVEGFVTGEFDGLAITADIASIILSFVKHPVAKGLGGAITAYQVGSLINGWREYIKDTGIYQRNKERLDFRATLVECNKKDFDDANEMLVDNAAIFTVNTLLSVNPNSYDTNNAKNFIKKYEKKYSDAA